MLSPDSTILLPPAFAGGIPRYALMARAPRVEILQSTPYNKRFKSTHRCHIADTRGKFTLTVPLIAPAKVAEGLKRPLLWSDMKISDHGNWRDIMLTALASAYGRTPFFEFYIDRFEEIIRSAVEGSALVDLDMAMENEICRILDIQTPTYVEVVGSATNLTREEVDGTTPPYWQLRQNTIGFIADISILDPIFNLGPETQLLLDRVEVNL